MVLSKQECWEYLRSSWHKAGNRDQCQATLLPLQVPTHQRIVAEGDPDQKGIFTDSYLMDPFTIKPITFAHWSTNSPGIIISAVIREGFSGIEALQGWTSEYSANLRTLPDGHVAHPPNPEDTRKIVSEQQTRRKDDQNINAGSASLNSGGEFENGSDIDRAGQHDVSPSSIAATRPKIMKTLLVKTQRSIAEASHFNGCGPVFDAESQNVSEHPLNRNPPASAADRSPWFPSNPLMRNLAQRETTFERRSTSGRLNLTNVGLVEDGLSYLGKSGRAKCWYCNSILQNWELDDEPLANYAECSSPNESSGTTIADSLTASTSISDYTDFQPEAFFEEETIPMKVWKANGRDLLQLHCSTDMNNFHQSSNEDRSSHASINGENQIGLHVDSVSDNDTSNEFPYNQESTQRMWNDEIRDHYESSRVPQQQTGVRVAPSSTAKIIDPVDGASFPGEYMEEIGRRTTFDNFPGRRHWHSLSVFWKSGFFYTGVADQVQCCFCSRIVENWGSEEDPRALCWHRSTCRRQQGHNEQTERQNNEQLSRLRFNRFDAAATPTHDEVCSEEGEEDLLTNHRQSGSLPRSLTPTDSCSSGEDHGIRSRSRSRTGSYTKYKMELKDCKDFHIYNCSNNDSINNVTNEIKNLRMTFVAGMLLYGTLFFWKKIKQSSSF